MILRDFKCPGDTKNFYSADCDFKFAEMSKILFSPDNSFTFDVPVTDKAIKDAVFAGKIFVLDVVQLLEDLSADPITEEINGNLRRVKEGQVREQWQVPAVFCTFENLVSWEGQMRRMWPIDKAGRIGGISDQTNSRIVGLQVDQFYANPKPLITNGTEAPKFSIDVYYGAEQLKINPFAFLGNIDYSEIKGLAEVHLIVNSVNGAELDCTIRNACSGSFVLGLSAGDFLKNGVAASSLTDNGDGNYLVTFADNIANGDKIQVKSSGLWVISEVLNYTV